MDSKHRHELKTNELADWLSHAPEFLKRNASTIIGIALIVIGLVTWPMFSRMRQQRDLTKAATVTESIQNLERDMFGVLQAAEQDEQTRQQAHSALMVSATALLDQADQADNRDLAALARIKAAQALRTELHLRAEQIDTDLVHTRIDQAQDAYKKALASATTPTLKAMAKLGLGLCAEELGQRDAAAAIYNEILETPEFAATIFPAKARQRLAGLTENLEPFVFAPAPVEAPAAVPLPEIYEPDMSSIFQTSPITEPQAPLMPFMPDVPTAPQTVPSDETGQE